jgi:hypothetical protein
MNTTTNAAPEREEIEQLIPWYAAGTLGRRDAARVEAAIKRDPELARQVELVREELSETILVNETLGAPSARAMQKLMAGIEAEGNAQRTPARFSLATWMAERLTVFTPRTLAYAATAAMLAIVVQFGALTGVAVNTAMKPSGGGYETASGPATQVRPGSYALIGFAPDAQIGQINGFLEKHRLTVVEGPRPGGLYRVRIADAPLSKPDAEQAISRLTADSGLIRMVLPEAPQR